ncbi:putative lipoyltransferase 2, mitochondrial isoform X1 [Schistocerca piceifrons]|uniref:putative lipoyltransferase 2, mitochondrial isoform X1 n=2 Tax=Schistocerca piceifrons TaxID=274613 RepID=UPI001F5F7F3F|nr:putative lipoyltransferase 2, mitochondrial isoform X1 [Schistocerca piceifrons]
MAFSEPALWMVQCFPGHWAILCFGMITPVIRVLQVGPMTYGRACHLQRILAKEHTNGNPQLAGTLILVEHPPVYTIGIRKREEYAQDQSRLCALGAEFHVVDRGGLVTFHGPGQMVAYPVLNLRFWKGGLRSYVSRLENTVIHTISNGFALQNVEARPAPYTGVWLGNAKICAIGVRASRQVTTHGLALNCCVDLDWFKHIIPCGLEGCEVTSLSQQLKRKVEIEEVVPYFLTAFATVFQCHLADYPAAEKQKLYVEM